MIFGKCINITDRVSEVVSLMLSKLSVKPREELEKVGQLRCSENRILIIVSVVELERIFDTLVQVVYMCTQMKENLY